MSYQVLALKWRPQQFDQVVGQSHAVQALSNALTQQRIHHAYLLTGTRGVGKTTIARIIAKCLNCTQGIGPIACEHCDHCQEINAGRFIDLIEVDAASRTKVEDTRDLLDNIQYAPSKGRFKVYLIDEVHMLSGHSFNALLKTLEEPPAHVKFLLATTDPKRLPATILSRCLQFHLLPVPIEQINQHLGQILTREQISFDANATLLISQAAKGSLRDALSLLDQAIAYGNGTVYENETKNMLGVIDTDKLIELLHALLQQDGNALLSGAADLARNGTDFNQALADLLSLFHQIAIMQVVNGAALDETPVMATLQHFAQQFSREDVQLYYQIALMGQQDLPLAPTPRIGFEMILLRLLAFTTNTTTADTTASINLSPSQATPSPMPSSVTKPDNNANDKAIPSQNLPWHVLVENLELHGGTLALARHCSCTNMTDSHLYLTVHKKQQPLLNKNHIERIEAGLQKYLGKTMTLIINVDDQTVETPASLIKEQANQQRKTAEQTLLDDTVVQQIMKKFDATLVKESVTIRID